MTLKDGCRCGCKVDKVLKVHKIIIIKCQGQPIRQKKAFLRIRELKETEAKESFVFDRGRSKIMHYDINKDFFVL